ncbi:DMT family transporter [Cribrihabitans sp. XS_ASV171]
MAFVSSVPQCSTNLDQRVGMIAMILAMTLLPVGDAISKTLTEVATPVQVTAWRTLAQTAFFVPVAILFRPAMTGPVFTIMSLISAVLILTVTLSLVTAFKTMPIATAIAIFFVEPLLLTLLAGPLLREAPGMRRYVACSIGLIGALIVIRPNFVAFGPVVLLPVVAAFAYAINMIVMRRATRRQSALGFQFGASVFAAVFVLASLPMSGAVFGSGAGDRLPDWVLPMVILAGALAMLSFLLIAFAFSISEASALAPFQYLEIVGAILVGFLVFDEMPDAMTLLGASIILASGAYVFHRERKRNIEITSATLRDR